ncbi:hypothetical protein AB1A96_13420, partial [Pseudomonas juntendi]
MHNESPLPIGRVEPCSTDEKQPSMARLYNNEKQPTSGRLYRKAAEHGSALQKAAPAQCAGAPLPSILLSWYSSRPMRLIRP